MALMGFIRRRVPWGGGFQVVGSRSRVEMGRAGVPSLPCKLPGHSWGLQATSGHEQSVFLVNEPHPGVGRGVKRAGHPGAHLGSGFSPSQVGPGPVQGPRQLHRCGWWRWWWRDPRRGGERRRRSAGPCAPWEGPAGEVPRPPPPLSPPLPPPPIPSAWACAPGRVPGGRCPIPALPLAPCPGVWVPMASLALPGGAEALAAGLALGLGLYALLYHNCLRGTKCRNGTSLRGKTVLITGGNTGIGKATALDLARRGARVVLACRHQARGEAAAYDLRRDSGNHQVLFMRLDLASLRSVRAFARAFLESEPRLDILIHNAGVNAEGPSEDGFNVAFQVNHLGPFLLTQLLLDRLKRCAPSRVVVVASRAHRSGKMDFESVHKPVAGALPAFLSYCNSKLANVLYARELAGRLEGTDVTCYALHPGVVNTELFRHLPAWLKPLFLPVAWLFFRDPTDGAQTSIYCATQEGLEAFSGRYFADCQVREPWPHARDDAAAKKLWEVSERLVGLAA